MPKKQDPALPLFPLQGQFFASLKAYQMAVNMLETQCDVILSLGLVEGKAAEILRERLACLRAAELGSETSHAP